MAPTSSTSSSRSTDTPLVKFAEGGIVVALALHMALGLRVLAIEFLPVRERTRRRHLDLSRGGLRRRLAAVRV